MRLNHWTGLVPIGLAGLLLAWLFLRRAIRRMIEEVRFDRARALFRPQREWLEARFLTALAQDDPVEFTSRRWDDAHWNDEVVWARERPSRRLLALIGVHFEPGPFDDLGDSEHRNATALFEFRKGRWHAEGKRLDEIRPDEAFLRHQRFEPVVVIPRRGS